MRKKIVSIISLLFLITCTTVVSDKADYVRRAYVKEVVKRNDSTVILYMNMIDSALVRNVRIVEYKAKVSNIFASMSHLTTVTQKYGGYVSSDHFKNNFLASTVTKLAEDSSLCVKQYYTSNTIVLRIPHFFIDTALIEINKNLEFIDYMYSKVNDSLIGIYAASKYLQGLNISYSNETSLQKWGANVNYDELIEEYTNNYGAIILSIYQNPELKVEGIKHPKIPNEYKAPFLMQTKLELGKGWKIIVDSWFFVLRNWPIFALTLLTILVLWINRQTVTPARHFKNWFDSPKN